MTRTEQRYGTEELFGRCRVTLPRPRTVRVDLYTHHPSCGLVVIVMVAVAPVASCPCNLNEVSVAHRYPRKLPSAHEAGVVLLRRLPSVGVDRFIAKSPSFGSFSAITAESVPFFGNGHETLGVETRILAMRRIC
eukprot:COSAG05_NODE_8170_length_729_cov_1.225397_2_plen_134_part_01